MMSKSLGTTGIQGMVGKTDLNRAYLGLAEQIRQLSGNRPMPF